LLKPPPPKVLAVEGQTVTISATYKGNYDSNDLQAYWIVKNTVSNTQKNVCPGNPLQGYKATVKKCPVDDPNCCKFQTSIVLESVTLEQSGDILKSAACRSDDLTKYKQGNSTISKTIMYYTYNITLRTFRSIQDSYCPSPTQHEERKPHLRSFY